MKLLILGASGAVGRNVLQQAIENQHITSIVAPTRSALMLEHPKLSNPTQVDIINGIPATAFDATICCVGTTLKAAGSKSKFLTIERDLVLACARKVYEHGCSCFSYVSSIGATPGKNFYLNTKHEIENQLKDIGFQSLTLVRPSLIDTARAEKRSAEQIALKLTRLAKAVLPLKYRAVPAARIAACLITSVEANKTGIQIIESHQLWS